MKNKITNFLEKENFEITNFPPFKKYLEEFETSDYKLVLTFEGDIFLQKKIDIKNEKCSISIEFYCIRPFHERVKIKKYDNQNFLEEEIQFMTTGTNKVKNKKYNRVVSKLKYDKEKSCISVTVDYYYFEKIQKSLASQYPITQEEILLIINQLRDNDEDCEQFIKENISFQTILEESKQLKLKK